MFSPEVEVSHVSLDPGTEDDDAVIVRLIVSVPLSGNLSPVEIGKLVKEVSERDRVDLWVVSASGVGEEEALGIEAWASRNNVNNFSGVGDEGVLHRDVRSRRGETLILCLPPSSLTPSFYNIKALSHPKYSRG